MLALVVAMLPSGIMTLAAENEGDISQEEVVVAAEEESDAPVAVEAVESAEEVVEGTESGEEVVEEEAAEEVTFTVGSVALGSSSEAGISLTAEINEEAENSVSVASESELNAAIADASGTAENPTVISLSQSFTISSVITVASGKYITINGNGYTILRDENSTNVVSSGTVTLATHAMLYVEGDVTLNNITIDARGDSTHLLRGVVVYGGNGVLKIYDSTIQGAYTASNAGGGLAVSGGSIAYLYSGTISGNTATSGAGVVTDSSSKFYMYDGSISDNIGIGSGGGGGALYYYSTSELHLLGGEICNNTTQSMDSSLALHGALYTNSALDAAAVEISGSMHIYNNTSDFGGVFKTPVQADICVPYNNASYRAYSGNDVWTEPTRAVTLTSALEYDLYFITSGATTDIEITRRTLLQGTDDYQLTEEDLAKVHLTYIDPNTYETTDLTNDDDFIILLLDNRIECFKKVTITFSSNEGESSSTEVQYTGYGAKATLAGTSIQKTGYTVSRWNTASDGTGTSYDAGQTLEETTALTADITLYAVEWEAEEYTISYELDGGTNSLTAPTTHTYGTATDLTSVTPTKTGYTFDGWYTDSNFETKVTSLAADGYTDDITLYAKWTPITYTIEYNNSDGSGTMASQKATYDEGIQLTANTFTKTGKNFAGWATDQSATSISYYDGSTVSNLTDTDGVTITLYAIWSDKGALSPDLSAQTKTYTGKTQTFDLGDAYTVKYYQSGEEVTPVNTVSTQT